MSGKVHVRAQVLFAMVPEWVLEAEITPEGGGKPTPLSAQAIRVYAVLARLGGEARVAEGVTHKEIADRSRCSVSTARRAIEDLRHPSVRAIEVTDNVDGRGRRESDYYVRVVPGEGHEADRSPVNTPDEADRSPVNTQAQDVVAPTSVRSPVNTPYGPLTGEQSKEPNPTTEKRKKHGRGKPRERNVAFDALARAAGKKLSALTSREGDQVGTALADILTAERSRLDVEDVDPGELARTITRTTIRIRRQQPTWPITVFTIAGHWSEFVETDLVQPVSPRDGHAFAGAGELCTTCGEPAYRHEVGGGMSRSLDEQREDRDAAAEPAAHVRVAIEDAGAVGAEVPA